MHTVSIVCILRAVGMLESHSLRVQGDIRETVQIDPGTDSDPKASILDLMRLI